MNDNLPVAETTTKLAKQKARSALVGEFKSNANRNLSEDQLRVMGEHAANYGWRIAALVSLKRVTKANQLRIARLGIGEGVLLYIVHP